MARPVEYRPSDEHKQIVSILAAIGTPEDAIAETLGTSRRTLARHYKAELRTAKTKVLALVANSLVKQALSGNVAAQCFYLKTQAGWRETSKIEVESTTTFADIIRGALDDPND